MNRRDFLTKSAMAGAALATVGISAKAFAAEPSKDVFIRCLTVYFDYSHWKRVGANFDWLTQVSSIGKIIDGLNDRGLVLVNSLGKPVDWQEEAPAGEDAYWSMTIINNKGTFKGRFIHRGQPPHDHSQWQSYLQSLPHYEGVEPGIECEMPFSDWDGPDFECGGISLSKKPRFRVRKELT